MPNTREDQNQLHAPLLGVGNFDWDWIIYIYAVYFIIVLIGGLLAIHTTFFGAALFLLFLYSRYWRNLAAIRIDTLRWCILLCIITPFVPLISYDQKTMAASFQELVKYLALHMVLLIGTTLPLTPLDRCRKNWILYGVILAYLVTGVLWSIAHGSHETRIQGFLPNPNGFALTAIMLFMLVNFQKPGTFFKLSHHLIVLSMILLSRTSGAILGYLAGILYLNVFGGKKHTIKRFSIAILIVSLVFTLFAVLPRNTIGPIDNTIDKIEVAKEQYQTILSGQSIDFSTIVQTRGEDASSGAWRLSQWYKIWSYYLNSPLDKILCGYGIGTTDVIFKLKAHNDYLRILFELGLVGFLFNIAVWVILYNRMARQYRWIVVTVAVFCLTENNYDHFPAMSLLVLYMLGAGGEAASLPARKTTSIQGRTVS